jgi:hypothetical protein
MTRTGTPNKNGDPVGIKGYSTSTDQGVRRSGFATPSETSPPDRGFVLAAVQRANKMAAALDVTMTMVAMAQNSTSCQYLIQKLTMILPT